MKKDSQISRRLFLRATTFAGAALASGFAPLYDLDGETRAPFAPPAKSQASGSASPSGSLNEWIERIFSREFAGKRFGPSRWDEDGKSYTVLESARGNRQVQELARYDSATGTRSVLFSSAELIPDGTKVPLRVEDFEWSRDRKKILIYTNSERVWRQDTRGDYWVYEREVKRLRKIGGDAAPSSLMFAKFSPSGDQVAYVRANNIYVEEISSGKIKALTTDGSETTINGTSDWVYEEEFDVRDGFRWSGDGRSIAYFQFDTRPVREFSMINNLGGGFREPITQIPYPEYGVYPKVWTFRIPSAGTPNSAVRIGVVNVNNAKTKWIDVTADPDKSYIPRMDWIADSNEILLQHMNRRQNTDDVYLADAHTGHAQRIFRDEDKAWLDVNEDTRWLAKHRGFLWANESDGWRHVYLIARDGSGARLVTHGDFDVIEILTVDPAEEWLYFIASPANATQHYLYRARTDGGSAAPERVTPPNTDGIHRYDISPDCKWALHTFSSFDVPPTTEIVSLPDHRVARVLADNSELRERLKVFGTRPTEFFQVDIGDGVKLDGWIIKPADFDASCKYPILFNVYGEPAAQTVLDGWSGGSLFHRALANQGYIVASVDNRGTPAPRGRAWRKIIYGAVGVLSSKEQAAAVHAMARERSYIDLDRVAVWGWSGGGTNTLNLMFRSPEIYKVGMSVAPVPDQRIYDTIYQERYMGLPQENAEGYKAGSAVNYADGLQGKLLLVHGTGDDNVHFAGSQLLVNRMIELGKSFDFMAYPNRTHGISEGAGTTVHIFKLLARHLTTHMPAAPTPRTMTLFLGRTREAIWRDS